MQSLKRILIISLAVVAIAVALPMLPLHWQGRDEQPVFAQTVTTAPVPSTTIHSSGSPFTMLGVTGFYWNNTASTYNWVLDAPLTNVPTGTTKQYCFGNYTARTGALTITTTTSVFIVYKGANGTVTTGTLVSGGAAGDFICLVSVDSTHYAAIGAGYGTWTNN